MISEIAEIGRRYGLKIDLDHKWKVLHTLTDDGIVVVGIFPTTMDLSWSIVQLRNAGHQMLCDELSYREIEDFNLKVI